MSKHTYSPKKNAIGEIDSAIHILCESNGSCTPTEVLALARITSTKEMLQVVVERAKFYEYRVIASGRGFRIVDAIWDFKNVSDR